MVELQPIYRSLKYDHKSIITKPYDKKYFYIRHNCYFWNIQALTEEICQNYIWNERFTYYKRCSFIEPQKLSFLLQISNGFNDHNTSFKLLHTFTPIGTQYSTLFDTDFTSYITPFLRPSDTCKHNKEPEKMVKRLLSSFISYISNIGYLLFVSTYMRYPPCN